MHDDGDNLTQEYENEKKASTHLAGYKKPRDDLDMTRNAEKTTIRSIRSLLVISHGF